MMLNDIQKDAVRAWVADGAGLSAVQQRIKDEFGLSMTYMDVRLLVIELNATLQDKPEPKSEEPARKAQPAAAEAPGAFDEAPEEELQSEALPAEEAVPEDFGAAKVSVTLDRVVRAGALASGDVTFSDGVTGSWFLDRMGRLSLTKVSKDNYQPTRADLEAFQIELQNKISSGMY